MLQTTKQQSDGAGRTLRSLDQLDNATSFTYDTDRIGAVTAFAISPTEERFAFTGREWDPHLQLIHFRARTIDPANGRFLERDPIGFDGGSSNDAYYRRRWCLDGKDDSCRGMRLILTFCCSEYGCREMTLYRFSNCEAGGGH